MKFRYFNDRPKDGAVRVMCCWHSLHVFVFHWGATVRGRRQDNSWRHWTIFYKPRPSERGRGGTLSVGTWLTRDGVTERVPQSKRYLLVKVLA